MTSRFRVTTNNVDQGFSSNKKIKPTKIDQSENCGHEILFSLTLTLILTLNPFLCSVLHYIIALDEMHSSAVLSLTAFFYEVAVSWSWWEWREREQSGPAPTALHSRRGLAETGRPHCLSLSEILYRNHYYYVVVMRLRLGRRLVNLLPLAQRTINKTFHKWRRRQNMGRWSWVRIPRPPWNRFLKKS